MAAFSKAGGGKDAARAAAAEFEACAKALPSHAYFANSAGKAWFVAGDAGRAKSWFEKAVGLNQGLLEPEYALGLVAMGAKNYDDAVAHAERGLALLPGNYSCLFVRAEANSARGQKDQAAADYQAVMQSAPPDSAEYKTAASRLGIKASK